MLAQVLDSGQEESASVDVLTALNIYNKLRLEDAHAVCALSQLMVGKGPTSPAFVAQLLLTVLLNKTLGKVAPKVSKCFCSVFSNSLCRKRDLKLTTVRQC